MATTEKRTREPRTTPEHDKLVMYLELSIKVLAEVDARQPSDNLKGQIAALSAVLRLLGVTEEI